MDLNALSLKELKSLYKNIERAISDFENRKRREALIELEKKAVEMGLSLSELAIVCKVKKINSPKYRNPVNVEQTWSGRGRTPLWIKDFENAGGSREDMLI